MFNLGEIATHSQQPIWLLADGKWRDKNIWNDNKNWYDYIAALYVAYFIPLIVTVNGTNYNFDQIGLTNNPELTCYRGTNYDFIINNSISPNTFVLRVSANETIQTIPGVFNHTPSTGISIGRIMFTPNDSTQNQICYQNTTTPTMSGRIIIRHYV